MNCPSKITDATIQAYRETEYRVYATTQFVLNVGIRSTELNRLHNRFGVCCSAFLTAWNPYSVVRDARDNATRQAALVARLHEQSLPFLSGVGQHPKGQWPAEASVLVLGLGRDQAIAVATRFEQNAVLWCGPATVPELVLLR
jgi:hypothetical protein